MRMQYQQPRLSHRDEIMQLMQGLSQQTGMDLQNAQIMQRLGQQQELQPLQMDRAGAEVQGLNLSNEMQQHELDSYDPMQEAKLQALQSQIAQNYGQGAYYGSQVMDPAVQQAIFQRMGVNVQPQQRPSILSPEQLQHINGGR